VSGPVPTIDVLRSIGFTDDPSVPSDDPGGLSIDFGNLTLSATFCRNRWFEPIVMLGGIYRTPRTLAEISGEMPREVESLEQGYAWIAWHLDNAAGGAFVPARPAPWLEVGRLHRHDLPWERERAEYDARPQCRIDRDLARAGLKQLAKLLSQTPDGTAVTFSFDGEILSIRAGGRLTAFSAEGVKWASSFPVPSENLKHLPKRLTTDPVEISVWQDKLSIGNCLYPRASISERPTSS
jgi:hypothetical protein